MNYFIYIFLQLQALGMDGATVMTSDQNGVTGLVQVDNPHVVGLHCVNHRLHLAVSKAADTVRNVKILSGVVSTIYIHINNSPNRLSRFNELANMLAMVQNENQENAEGDGPIQHKYLKFKKVSLKLHNILLYLL